MQVDKVDTNHFSVPLPSNLHATSVYLCLSVPWSTTWWLGLGWLIPCLVQGHINFLLHNPAILRHHSLFCLGTTHLPMPNFDGWHLASLLPTQHGHSCHHICVVLQQLDLCIWAGQQPLHITPHESGICVTPCTSSVSLTTSCPTSWD